MRKLTVVLALAGLAASAHASPPPPRPFFPSTLTLIRDYGLSPLNLGQDGVQAAAALGLVALALHQHDFQLHAALSTGDRRKPWLDASMPVVSDLGEGWVEALAVSVGWALGSERFGDTSARALQAMAVSAVYSQALKYVFWSNRPYENPSQHRYFAYEQSSRSMPSGHTYSAFAIAEVYGAEYGRWMTYPFALLMGYSRLYNQAHWSSDVFVGAVLGVAAGYQAHRAARTQGQPRLWRFTFAAPTGPGLALSRNF